MKTPTVIGCCVQGASHKRTNVECQDSKKWLWLNDDSVVVSVADGHGSKSCPYSKTGSKTAVNVFCDIMNRLYQGYKNNLDALLTFLYRDGDTKIAQMIQDEWNKRIYSTHRKKKRDIQYLADGTVDKAEVYKQYGTTVLGILVTPEFVFAFQIGDGDITYASETEVKPFLVSSKILGTETHSLSKSDAWKKAITVLYRTESFPKENTALIMSTDGFSNSFINENEYHVACRDYCNMLSQYGEAAVKANLKDWLDETSQQGCGDDITLVMLYYGEENEQSDYKTCSSES